MKRCNNHKTLKGFLKWPLSRVNRFHVLSPWVWVSEVLGYPFHPEAWVFRGQLWSGQLPLDSTHSNYSELWFLPKARQKGTMGDTSLYFISATMKNIWSKMKRGLTWLDTCAEWLCLSWNFSWSSFIFPLGFNIECGVALFFYVSAKPMCGNNFSGFSGSW